MNADTELKSRWDAYLHAKATVDPESVEGLDLRIELERIELAYRDIVNRRLNGELTDDGRVAPLLNVIEEVSLFAGMETRCRYFSGGLYKPAKFSWFWILQLVAVKEGAFDAFDRLVDNIDAEIVQLPFAGFVCPPSRGWLRPHNEFYYDRWLDNDGIDGKKDYTIPDNWRRGVEWNVDTMIWDGPPHLRRELRKKWA